MTIDAALREAASGRGTVALVTVARSTGSTPRHAGSRLACRSDGSFVGTVGGGRPEADALVAARACLASGRNGMITIEMTGAEATGSELICGGTAEMWVELVDDPSLYRAAVKAVDAGAAALLVGSAADGCLAVLSADGRLLAGRSVGRGAAPSGASGGPAVDGAAAARARESGLPQIGADGFLYMPLEPSDRLLVLGGGHVGLAVARAAAELSFRTTVADPRPEFSDPARFPEGVECRRSEFVEAIDGFPFGPSSYVVVVSPGHLGDLECVRAILKKEYRYAGFIGSRRKSRMLIDELIAEGADRAKAEALHSPIGLDIGAETPEEIAVAILAEMIAVRRGSSNLVGTDMERWQRRSSS